MADVKKKGRKVYFTRQGLIRIRDRLNPFSHDGTDEAIIMKIEQQLEVRGDRPLGVKAPEGWMDPVITGAERALLQQIAHASQTSTDPDGQQKRMRSLVQQWLDTYGGGVDDATE